MHEYEHQLSRASNVNQYDITSLSNNASEPISFIKGEHSGLYTMVANNGSIVIKGDIKPQPTHSSLVLDKLLIVYYLP